MKRRIDAMTLPRPERGRRSAPARALAALLLATGVAACFGEIIIERERVSEQQGGAGSDVAPLTPGCEIGAVRCNGQWLEVCGARMADNQPEWNKRQDCLSPVLCQDDPGRCVEPECRAGEWRCTGAVPETCKGTLDGFDALGACVNAAHCSLDDTKCAEEGKAAPCCLDVPCEAGELRCNGSEMQRCRDDQTDLDVVASCETLELCDASRPDCGPTQTECVCAEPVCDAGETRCVGLGLERCNPGRTGWEPVQDCVTEELCELGRALVPLACAPAACIPGEHNCDGETLELCNAGQSDFDPLTVCVGGPGFCNEVLGICSQCEVGDTRCDLAQIQVCRQDRSGFDPVAGRVCETPQLCAIDGSGAAFCAEPACDVDEFDCDGAQLERCNAGRTDFEPFGQPCNSAALCSETRERCDFCVPNRPQCNANRTASQACSANGNLGATTACPLGCIPETGLCRSCTIGTYRCNGNALSRCDDGFSFTPLNRAADCSGASRVTCNAGNLQSTACGTFGCSAARSACNECSAEVPASCAGGLSCTSTGLCRCAANAFVCDDDTLLRCNAAGTATAAGPRCSGGTQNEILRTCDEGVLAQNTCGSGQLCSISTGSQCAVCVPGTLSCAGGSLSVCNGAGTGTGPAETCVGVTRRTCQGAQLVQIDCGSNALCQASSGSACAECLANEEPSCTFEGLEVRCQAGQFVTSECLEGTSCVEGTGCVAPGL